MKRGRLFKNAIALIMCFAMLLGCSGKIAYGNIESVQGNAPRVLSVLADELTNRNSYAKTIDIVDMLH